MPPAPSCPNYANCDACVTEHYMVYCTFCNNVCIDGYTGECNVTALVTSNDCATALQSCTLCVGVIRCDTAAQR
jgi:hypothetical protein